MALTRQFLSALGIEAEKVEEIVLAHAETVDALKKERDSYKEEAGKVKGLTEELEQLKSKGDNSDALKALKDEFKQYKADVEAEKVRAKQLEAYRGILHKAGISDKRIDSVLKVSSDKIGSIEFDGDKVKDADALVKDAKKEWSDFVVTEQTVGAKVDNPPAGNGKTVMTKAEIMSIKDTSARQKAIAENLELFGYK